MTCPDCKDSGWITLLSSRVPCECQAVLRVMTPEEKQETVETAAKIADELMRCYGYERDTDRYGYQLSGWMEADEADGARPQEEVERLADTITCADCSKQVQAGVGYWCGDILCIPCWEKRKSAYNPKAIDGVPGAIEPQGKCSGCGERFRDGADMHKWRSGFRCTDCHEAVQRARAVIDNRDRLRRAILLNS